MRTRADLELEERLRMVAEERGVDYEQVLEEFVERAIRDARDVIGSREEGARDDPGRPCRILW